jgi:hypothetical protein
MLRRELLAANNLNSEEVSAKEDSSTRYTLLQQELPGKNVPFRRGNLRHRRAIEDKENSHGSMWHILQQRQ